MLTKSESVILAKLEGLISPTEIETFSQLMLESECDIILLSKYACVSDLSTIVNGCEYGRRKIAQYGEKLSDKHGKDKIK